jgi:hypothetical protein
MLYGFDYNTIKETYLSFSLSRYEHSTQAIYTYVIDTHRARYKNSFMNQNQKA